MPNVSEQISQILLKKLREEELSAEEAAILAEWEGRSPEHAEFIAMLMDEASLSDKIKNMLELDERAAWQRIERALAAEWNERAVPQTRKITWYKYAVAASVILFVGIVGFFLLSKKETVSETSKATKPATVADIAPGGNRAELTLADGSVIDLGKAENGEVANEGGSKVMKTESGRLVYELFRGNDVAGKDSKYNTLKTPRGGEFQVTLPDGTKVWLNAASSIKYPTVFEYNKERLVEIAGEVYFEVAKDTRRKFRAIINSADGHKRGEVEVLGTHFNIMAYDEEKYIATTLLEGKVKIATNSSPDENKQKVPGIESAAKDLFDFKTLFPGQQAQLTPNNKLKIVNQADTTRIVAWKNGLTSFKDADVRTIMNQLSRWYNFEVVYAEGIPDMQYTGDIERYVNISKVLDILKFAGLNFKIEEGKVTVMR